MGVRAISSGGKVNPAQKQQITGIGQAPGNRNRAAYGLVCEQVAVAGNAARVRQVRF
jgi:hypothetical protein